LACSGVVGDYVDGDERRRPAIVSNVIGGDDVIQIAAVVKTFTVPMFSAHYDIHSKRPAFRTIHN
jgi:hypothetical protein